MSEKGHLKSICNSIVLVYSLHFVLLMNQLILWIQDHEISDKILSSILRIHNGICNRKKEINQSVKDKSHKCSLKRGI